VTQATKFGLQKILVPGVTDGENCINTSMLWTDGWTRHPVHAYHNRCTIKILNVNPSGSVGSVHAFCLRTLHSVTVISRFFIEENGHLGAPVELNVTNII